MKNVARPIGGRIENDVEGIFSCYRDVLTDKSHALTDDSLKRMNVSQHRLNQVN